MLRALVLTLALLPLACGDKEPGDSEATAPLTTTGTPPTGDETTATSPTSGDDTTGLVATTVDTTTTDGTTAGPVTATTTTADPTSTTTTTGDATTAETTDPSTTTTGLAPCEGDAPKIKFSTTLGDMVLQLDAINAPNTTANFISYVQDGFYDDTIFHRVIDGFVIQGGGFTPELQQKQTKPPIALEISPLKHIDGAISMARTNDPNSATSQFFVCDGPQAGLDGNYAVFGVLVEGFDVLAAISAVPVGDENGFTDVPVEDVIVNEAVCVP